MSRKLLTGLIVVVLFATAFVWVQNENSEIVTNEASIDAVEWSINATAIEACTCPMFCQCYFNTEPASHSHEHGEEEHYCKFNMAWKVNKGHYGDTDLTGALYWMAGDLGSDWEDGMMDWSVVHFDPSVTEEQRRGIVEIIDPMFPVEWSSYIVGEDKTIEWKADNREAVALLDNGNAGEMHLIHPPTAMSEDPAVLTNVHYWAVPRHEGFVLMPNEVQAYRSGDKPFESSGTNGFMITVDMNSSDI